MRQPRVADRLADYLSCESDVELRAWSKVVAHSHTGTTATVRNAHEANALETATIIENR